MIVFIIEHIYYLRFSEIYFLKRIFWNVLPWETKIADEILVTIGLNPLSLPNKNDLSGQTNRFFCADIRIDVIPVYYRDPNPSCAARRGSLLRTLRLASQIRCSSLRTGRGVPAATKKATGTVGSRADGAPSARAKGGAPRRAAALCLLLLVRSARRGRRPRDAVVQLPVARGLGGVPPRPHAHCCLGGAREVRARPTNGRRRRARRARADDAWGGGPWAWQRHFRRLLPRAVAGVRGGVGDDVFSC